MTHLLVRADSGPDLEWHLVRDRKLRQALCGFVYPTYLKQLSPDRPLSFVTCERCLAKYRELHPVGKQEQLL